MRSLCLTLLVLFAACGDSVMPASVACVEQSDAYCAAVGYPNTGCEIVYVNTVCRLAPDQVDSDDHSACLAGIADMTSGALPDVCAMMWRSR